MTSLYFYLLFNTVTVSHLQRKLFNHISPLSVQQCLYLVTTMLAKPDRTFTSKESTGADNSVVEHLPGTWEALGSIPSTHTVLL